MSFRQTISGAAPSDRGFMVKIDRDEQKVLISFDASRVAVKYAAWLQNVKEHASLGELNPQPYWGFSDLPVVCCLGIFTRFRAINLDFLEVLNSGVMNPQNTSKDAVFPESTNYR